jgi:hypothetical protein
MEGDRSARTARSRRRDLVREWWWTALPVVVVLSIGVSSITGPSGPNVGRDRSHAGVVSRVVVGSPPVVVSEAHRLPVGHRRPIPFDFDACVAARSDVSPRREAQRYCLALAHLHISTPFSMTRRS